MGQVRRWPIDRERELVKKFGGTPVRKYTHDGEINGRPIEVKAVRVDHRFRIGKKAHHMLLSRGGVYIFDAPGYQPKKLTARQVDSMLPPGKWYQDRTYPHKFILVREVFTKRGLTTFDVSRPFVRPFNI
jgi:hypothetical protein